MYGRTFQLNKTNWIYIPPWMCADQILHPVHPRIRYPTITFSESLFPLKDKNLRPRLGVCKCVAISKGIILRNIVIAISHCVR